MSLYPENPYAHQALVSIGLEEKEKQPFPSLTGRIDRYLAKQTPDGWDTYFLVGEQPFTIQDRSYHPLDLGERIKVYFQPETVPFNSASQDHLIETEITRAQRKEGERKTSEIIESLPTEITQLRVMGYRLFHPDHTLKRQVAFAGAAFYGK